MLLDRSHTHGKFSDQARLSQEFKTTLSTFQKDNLSYPQREALEMILHKISRIVMGDPNFIDHWDDISGYAILIADDLKEQKDAVERPTNKRD